MMAFDSVFLEVARNESRGIHALGGAGAVRGTFLFRELYCEQPGCDCRRVVLEVQWAEKQQVAATIHYALERPKRRGEPQLYLDPSHPQSDLANGLLDVFEDLIKKDAAYRATLRRHYKMWKTSVNGPSHARAGNEGLVRIVAKTSQLDSSLQQRFRKLLAKVEVLRTRVQTWRQQRPDIDREMAVYEAAFTQQERLTRELVILLDHACTSGRLTKADTMMLAEMLSAMARDLLEEGAAADDELQAIYKRHSRRDFDRENAKLELAQVSELRSMMESLGLDFGDTEIGSLEELEAFTRAQLAADEVAPPRERKKSAKQHAKEAKRADEDRSAHKAVQDVYRSLAKALHPDLEQDPVEQQRKAELMKEVNVAYESDDLLRLLELELQLEGVDVAKVDVLAEERVRHYLRVLDQQAKQLQIEIEQLELPFRMSIGMSRSAKLVPANVISRIQADVKALRASCEALSRDLTLFADPREIKRWLKTERRARSYE